MLEEIKTKFEGNVDETYLKDNRILYLKKGKKIIRLLVEGNLMIVDVYTSTKKECFFGLEEQNKIEDFLNEEFQAEGEENRDR